MSKRLKLPLVIMALLFLLSILGHWWKIIDLNHILAQLEGFLSVFFPKLLVLAIFILIAQILIEITSPLLEKNKSIEFLGDRRLFISFYSYVLYFLAIILGALVVSENIAAIITSLGLVGLGLAYALQQPIQNIAGWLTIVFTKPYRTHDRITMGSFSGDVDSITIMYTRLREFGATGDSPSGRIINMPNSKVLSEPTVNYTLDVPYIWDEIFFPLTFESDWRKASRLLEKAAAEAVGQEHRDAYEALYPILAGTPTAVHLSEKPIILLEIGQSGVTFKVRYLVNTRKRIGFKTALYRKILESMNRKDMKFAYPHMEIILENQQDLK